MSTHQITTTTGNTSYWHLISHPPQWHAPKRTIRRRRTRKVPKRPVWQRRLTMCHMEVRRWLVPMRWRYIDFSICVELTSAQKAARTRAANKAAKEFLLLLEKQKVHLAGHDSNTLKSEHAESLWSIRRPIIIFQSLSDMQQRRQSLMQVSSIIIRPKFSCLTWFGTDGEVWWQVGAKNVSADIIKHTSGNTACTSKNIRSQKRKSQSCIE